MLIVYLASCDPLSGNYSHKVLSYNTIAQVEGNCNDGEKQ